MPQHNKAVGVRQRKVRVQALLVAAALMLVKLTAYAAAESPTASAGSMDSREYRMLCAAHTVVSRAHSYAEVARKNSEVDYHQMERFLTAVYLFFANEQQPSCHSEDVELKAGVHYLFLSCGEASVTAQRLEIYAASAGKSLDTPLAAGYTDSSTRVQLLPFTPVATGTYRLKYSMHIADADIAMGRFGLIMYLSSEQSEQQSELTPQGFDDFYYTTFCRLSSSYRDIAVIQKHPGSISYHGKDDVPNAWAFQWGYLSTAKSCVSANWLEKGNVFIALATPDGIPTKTICTSTGTPAISIDSNSGVMFFNHHTRATGPAQLTISLRSAEKEDHIPYVVAFLDTSDVSAADMNYTDEVARQFLQKKSAYVVVQDFTDDLVQHIARDMRAVWTCGNALLRVKPASARVSLSAPNNAVIEPLPEAIDSHGNAVYTLCGLAPATYQVKLVCPESAQALYERTNKTEIKISDSAGILEQPIALQGRGHLSLAIDPPDASVTVDDQLPAPITTPLHLTPGEHKLQVHKDGYQDQTVAITLRQGDNPAQRITLEPLPVTVELIAIEKEVTAGQPVILVWKTTNVVRVTALYAQPGTASRAQPPRIIWKSPDAPYPLGTEGQTPVLEKDPGVTGGYSDLPQVTTTYHIIVAGSANQQQEATTTVIVHHGTRTPGPQVLDVKAAFATDAAISMLALGRGGDSLLALVDGAITRFDPQGRRSVLKLAPAEHPFTMFSCSPDSKVLAYITEKKVYQLFNGAKMSYTGWLSGEDGKEACLIPEEKQPVTALAFSTQGDMLAWADSAGSLNVGNVQGAAKTAIHPLPDCTNLLALAFSPDDTQLAGLTDSGWIRIWDLHNRRLVKMLHLRDESCAIAWSTDGKTIVHAAKNGQLRWLNVSSGKDTGDFWTPPVPVKAVAFSTDRQYYAVYTGKECQVYQLP